LDKAAYLTALLALGSLLAGSITGIIVQSITGMGFATALVAFVQAASKATEVAPKASLVPNVPQQAEELSASIEQAATGSPEPPERTRPVFLAAAIFALNLRPISLIPAIHSVLPFSMLLEGRGRLKALGKRHEDFIMASALTPLIINGYAVGGSVSEYPITAPILVMDILPLAIVSYVASKALLLPLRGLDRLEEAYKGAHSIFTFSLMLLSMAAAYEAHILYFGGGYGG
jgi:hypothetical protein